MIFCRVFIFVVLLEVKIIQKPNADSDSKNNVLSFVMPELKLNNIVMAWNFENLDFFTKNVPNWPSSGAGAAAHETQKGEVTHNVNHSESIAWVAGA